MKREEGEVILWLGERRLEALADKQPRDSHFAILGMFGENNLNPREFRA
jgi:hypothetical protein